MVSKQISDSIKEAKEALDQVETIGRTAYDLCDGILNNIKGFVHYDIVWKKINDHEERVHRDFKKRTEIARVKLKDLDPLYAWNDGMKFFMELRHWKSLEMLNFWDKPSKEHGEL